MKLVTFEQWGCQRIGILVEKDTAVAPLDRLACPFPDMNALVRGADATLLANLQQRAQQSPQIGKPLHTVRLTAPIPHPVRDIVCMGLNYQEHAGEMSKALNEQPAERIWPIYFGKRVDRARGHQEAIPSHTGFVSSLDYECELAVVIGKDARNVAPQQVREYIFGYTVLNDITARELKKHKQNYFQKSLDGTCPMGPWIVTADDIAYPPDLQIKLWVNGEMRQNGRTSQMLFSLNDIISDLSQGITLQAGTIIATGTPTGIGFGMNPPVYLTHGDVVRCEIEQIGVLENQVDDNET